MSEFEGAALLVWDAALQWLGHGLSGWAWWQVVLFTLAFTHVTIACVTIFLHRSQAHRALDLHPAVAHFMRLWLWLGTGMVTKEWVAIHRKHHAKCETADDPHSPQTRGIRTVLLQGSELYRAEAKNTDTLARYGHGTPDDWIERHLYSRFTWQGVGLTLILDLALFGAAGAAVWAVQMLWIPITAAGIINGIGHYWGYRNFEAADASRNVSPWGVIIGGEELHNNHHTYPTSAKLSVKKGEFDIGWVYIRTLSWLGLATVRKLPPKLQLGAVKAQADHESLEAIIAHRYELMAAYARHVRKACAAELDALKARHAAHRAGRATGQGSLADLAPLQAARKWLHRDHSKVPASLHERLAAARAAHPVLDKMVHMRDELTQMWSNTHRSREQLAADLHGWCQRAEQSGIEALQRFALQLRAARV